MAILQSMSISGNDSYILLPKGSTVQRTIGSTGMIRYNTDINKPEMFDGSSWISLGNPYSQHGRSYYNEDSRADLFTSNWNNATTFTMNEFGGLGYVNAHLCPDNANKTLTLNNLPGHNKIRFQVFIHCVDSFDGETHNLFLMNSGGTETEFLRFTKGGGTDGVSISVLASGARTGWNGSKTYAYTPWPGTIDGYILFDSNYYAHTSSTFTARMFSGTNEGQANEAMYLSHVQVWLGS